MIRSTLLCLLTVLLDGSVAFLPYSSTPSSPSLVKKYPRPACSTRRALLSSSSSSSAIDNENDDDILVSRLPTSVEDQTRQCFESLTRATHDGYHRHTLKLLLPVIGATELDDWPGGSRQQMEAAYPILKSVLMDYSKAVTVQQHIIDQSDGVCALLAQAEQACDDSCTVLLPTADTMQNAVLELEQQTGPSRNVMLVNPQWRRRSDFGGVFGSNQQLANHVETTYAPTFILNNLIVEGESIRVLRAYPEPWRVFVQTVDENDSASIDWKEIGRKAVVELKPLDWEQQKANKRDGGLLFSYGQPSYQEINDMLNSAENYTPKSPAERAVAAFNFIKDTL